MSLMAALSVYTDVDISLFLSSRYGK